MKMAGVGGFEPPHGDTKNRCLTAWLHPNDDRSGRGTLCNGEEPSEQYSKMQALSNSSFVEKTREKLVQSLWP